MHGLLMNIRCASHRPNIHLTRLIMSGCLLDPYLPSTASMGPTKFD